MKEDSRSDILSDYGIANRRFRKLQEHCCYTIAEKEIRDRPCSQAAISRIAVFKSSGVVDWRDRPG